MDTKSRRQIFSWALYDWANSAYATIVMAVLFQILFSDYWYTESENSTTPLGIANALSSLTIVILAPILGAIADKGHMKKRLLSLFALLGILATAAMTFLQQGQWELALGLYILSGIGFSGANTFYDALIVDVSPPNRYDFISGLGFALGYLSGGIVLLLVFFLQKYSSFFSLQNQTQAQLFSFLIVALWWLVFTIPLWKYVHEKEPPKAIQFGQLTREGFGQLKKTLKDIQRFRVVVLFLISYWLYMDGVDTIVRMAMNYGKRLGFPDDALIKAFLVTQFVGFPAALLYGYLGEKVGPKRSLLFGILVYIFATIWGFFLTRVEEFYVLAIVIGLVQGGVQSMSRSLYARIIPKDKSGEFFGFYNMLGKFAAVLGPLIMALMSSLTGSPRWAILSVLVLFIGGGFTLFFVDVEEGKARASAVEQVPPRNTKENGHL